MDLRAPLQLLTALTGLAPLLLQEWFSKKFSSASNRVIFSIIRAGLVLTTTVVAVAVPGELGSLCLPQQTFRDCIGSAIASVLEGNNMASGGCWYSVTYLQVLAASFH